MNDLDYLQHLLTIFRHLDILSKLPEKQETLKPIRNQFRDLIAQIITENNL